MEAIATRAERVAYGRRQRRDEADRRARQRPPQRRIGRRPSGAVRREAGPPLEAPKRAVGASTEIAVECPGRKSVPGERELQSSHVPPARADGELPLPERRSTAVAAECSSSARPRHSVRCEAGSPLKSTESLLGSGAEDAVDGAGVEAVRAQADLKRSDIWIAARRSAAGKSKHGERGNKYCTDPHPETRIGEIQPIPIPQKGDSVRGIESPLRGTRGPENAPILRTGVPVRRRREQHCGGFERCRESLRRRCFPWDGSCAPSFSSQPRSMPWKHCSSRRVVSTRSSTTASTTAYWRRLR